MHAIRDIYGNMHEKKKNTFIVTKTHFTHTICNFTNNFVCMCGWLTIRDFWGMPH